MQRDGSSDVYDDHVLLTACTARQSRLKALHVKATGRYRLLHLHVYHSNHFSVCTILQYSLSVETRRWNTLPVARNIPSKHGVRWLPIETRNGCSWSRLIFATSIDNSMVGRALYCSTMRKIDQQVQVLHGRKRLILYCVQYGTTQGRVIAPTEPYHCEVVSWCFPSTMPQHTVYR